MSVLAVLNCVHRARSCDADAEKPSRESPPRCQARQIDLHACDRVTTRELLAPQKFSKFRLTVAAVWLQFEAFRKAPRDAGIERPAVRAFLLRKNSHGQHSAKQGTLSMNVQRLAECVLVEAPAKLNLFFEVLGKTQRRIP